MAVNLSPIGGVAAQFLDNNGNPLTGGKIYTYAAGTTTPQATYTSSNGLTPHANPTILDAAGRVPGGEIWLTDGLQYKFVIKTSTDVQIGSYDNIIGINSNFVNYTNSQEIQTATAGQTVFTLTTMVYQPGTNSLSVFVDGVNQYGPGALYSYTETSDTIVTFNAGLHVGAEVKFTTSSINASSYGDAAQISYTAPYVGCVTTNVEARLAQYISVKDFGAVGNGITDDTTAIQAALDAVELAGGGTVFIPSGEYKVTATINLPSLVSLEGQGQFSRFRVYGCNGLNILASNIIGPRRVANFWLHGSGADAYSGIVSSIASPQKAQGLVFENLYISFFGTGVSTRGLWHSVFRSTTIHQVWKGVYIYDRNVKIVFDDCRITLGGSVSGTGNSIGLQVGDTAFALRPEDIQVTNSLIYGFNIGVFWRTCLFGGITNCDIDACSIKGLELVNGDGGFTFSNNWVQVNNASSTIYGIHLLPLAVKLTLGNVTISNNYIISSTTSGTAYGIYVDYNQANLLIDGNSVSGAWSDGLYANAIFESRIVNNNIGATLGIQSSTNIALAENYVSGIMTLSSNTILSCGKNYGPTSTKIQGQLTIPAGATTATATFASLSLPNLPSGTYSSLVLFNNPATSSRGEVWGNTTTTDITVYVGSSFGSPAGVSFTIEVF